MPALRTGSLRRRTVLAVLGLLTVLLLALGFTVQLVLGDRLRAQLEERLHDRASAAAALIGTVSNDELANRLSAQGVSVLIRSADGGSVVAGPTPDELRAGPPAGGAGLLPGPGGSTGNDSERAAPTAAAGSATETASIVDSELITSDAQIVTLESTLSEGSTLTLTVDASGVEQTLVQLRWIMLAASAAFLLVAAGALGLVVRGSLRPLESMTALARDIGRGDRGRRLRPSRPATEIGRVAEAFDEMLDSIEGAERAAQAAERAARESERAALVAEQTAREAEARVRSFVSDAAHELRTPVAGLQAAADTLVRAPVDRLERERLATHVVREAGRAARLIDDMLLMARVDRGLVLESAPVDLAAVMLVEAERQRLRRPALDLSVTGSEQTVTVAGDRERLTQIVANVVDNAARMTRGAGPVTLELSRGGTRARLTVRDHGPGVPAGEGEYIFDRLVRLEGSRTADGGGAGLGLPIARGLARAHGGELAYAGPARAGAESPGAVFVLELPLPDDGMTAGLLVSTPLRDRSNPAMVEVSPPEKDSP